MAEQATASNTKNVGPVTGVSVTLSVF